MTRILTGVIVLLILGILLAMLFGCQSVAYSVDVSGDDNVVEIPGDAEIAKPIEISPGRELKDNELKGLPGL